LDRRLAAASVTMFLLAVAMANPRSQAHISGDGDNRSMQLRRRVQTDWREVLGAAYGWRDLRGVRSCARIVVGKHPRSHVWTYWTRQKAGM